MLCITVLVYSPSYNDPSFNIPSPSTSSSTRLSWSFQLQLTSSSVFLPCLIFCWHLDCSFVWSFSLMISFSVPFIISDNPLLALALALYLQLPLFCYLSYLDTSFHVFLFCILVSPSLVSLCIMLWCCHCLGWTHLISLFYVFQSFSVQGIAFPLHVVPSRLLFRRLSAASSFHSTAIHWSLCPVSCLLFWGCFMRRTANISPQKRYKH